MTVRLRTAVQQLNALDLPELERRAQSALSQLFSHAELDGSTQILVYLFERASVGRQDSADFLKYLLALGIETTRANRLAALWSKESLKVLDQLCQESASIGHLPALERIGWNSTIRLGTPEGSRRDVQTRFSLHLSNGNVISFEQDREELFSLFESLERVQTQLDVLSGK